MSYEELQTALVEFDLPLQVSWQQDEAYPPGQIEAFGAQAETYVERVLLRGL